MTAFQDRVLAELLAAPPGGVTAWELARRVCPRRSRGATAVHNALRALIGRGRDLNPNVMWRGQRVILTRLPPRDQHGDILWFADVAMEREVRE